jgi:hypothetical protein
MANEHNHLGKKHPPKVEAKGIYFLECFTPQVLPTFFWWKALSGKKNNNEFFSCDTRQVSMGILKKWNAS